VPDPLCRKNKEGDAVAMLELHKTDTANLGSKALEENPGLVARDIFVDREKPEYCEYCRNSLD